MHPQVLAHPGPIGLVLFEFLVAEALAHVEGDSDVIGFLVPQDVEEHRGEAVNGIGGLAFGGAHIQGQSVISPVRQGVAVHKHELLHNHASLYFVNSSLSSLIRKRTIPRRTSSENRAARTYPLLNRKA